MNGRSFVPVLAAVAAASLGTAGCGAAQESRMIRLPTPDTVDGTPLTRTLLERRSVRTFGATPLAPLVASTAERVEVWMGLDVLPGAQAQGDDHQDLDGGQRHGPPSRSSAPCFKARPWASAC